MEGSVIKPGVCEYDTTSTKTFRDFSIYDAEGADKDILIVNLYSDDLIEICKTKIVLVTKSNFCSSQSSNKHKHFQVICILEQATSITRCYQIQ